MTAIATRNAKTTVTVADLDDAWRRAALPLGVSRERIEVLRHQPHPALEPAGADERAGGADRVRRDLPRPRRPCGRAGALRRRTDRDGARPAPRAASNRARSSCSPTGPAPPASTAAANARSSRSPSDSPHAARTAPHRDDWSPEIDRLDHDLARHGGRLCPTSSAPRSSSRAASQRAGRDRGAGRHREEHHPDRRSPARTKPAAERSS